LENIRLREENARLRRLLAIHSIPVPQIAPEDPPPTKPVKTAPPVDREERARQRITLFRTLFRGREDVYARRWENDNDRHGYVLAAVKDWEAINKSLPEERKKVDQKTRRFLPLTDAVNENHLLGKETVGIYPLLLDETCWFSRWISTRRPGSATPWLSLRPAGKWAYPLPWSVPVLGRVVTYGFSLIVPCLRLTRAN
jgi:hypothetical protein